MPLSEQRRRQLDEIVVKMANQNAPKEDVVAIVNDFKSKFENEGVSSVQPNNPLAPVMTQQKQVVLTPAQPPQQNKPGLLRRAAGAVGDVAVGFGKGVLDVPREFASLGADLGTKFGETGIGRKLGAGIRSTLGGTINPETARTLQAGLQGGTEQTNFTKPQNTAQKVGFGAEKVAEFFVPGGAAGKLGKVVSEAGVAAKLPRAGKFLGATTKAIADAGINTAQQAAQQGNTDNFLQNALLFGGLSTGGAVLGKAGNYLTKSLPKRLADSALKPSIKELEKTIKYGDKTLGAQVAEKGIFGTDAGLLKKSALKLEENENKLQSIIKNSKETIQKSELNKYFDPIIEKLSKTPGLESEFNSVVQVYDQIPKTLSLVEANQMKRNLYSVLNDRAYVLDPSLSSKKETMKALAKGLKTEIENKTAGSAGKDTVRKINQELALYGKINEKALNNLAKEEKSNILPSVFSYGLPILGGAGVGYGSSGDLSGATAGALGFAALRTGFGTTLGKTVLAKTLNKTGALAPVIRATGKAAKVGIVKKSQ